MDLYGLVTDLRFAEQDGNQEASASPHSTADQRLQHASQQQLARQEEQRAPNQDASGHPAHLVLTTLPDGIATWQDQRGIQIVWLLSSIFMVILDVVGYDIGFVAGLLGITGASLATCSCCQFMDLRGIVKVMLPHADFMRVTPICEVH